MPEWFDLLVGEIGVLPAAMIAGLLWDRFRLVKRVDHLTDRSFANDKETTSVLSSVLELMRRLEAKL